ncbi:hypothetical protein GCM10022286_08020 [Gryllotalpicola daejeonensis]|uniref:Transglutaminase-like domain-containing protein n=1 Tax=Gryllotalpicola daejeonensis TaxID=993087 RepID=A0ABP7ZGD9_9MICO
MFDRPRPTLAQTAVTRGSWRVAGALFLEIIACSIALIGLIQGTGWWFALIGVSALLLAVPAALRALGLNAWAAAGLNVLVFGLLVQLAFVPRLALLGVIPTPRSFAGLAELFRQALVAIQSQHTPAVALPELVFFIVLFGGALAVVLDVLAVALRLPAVTAVVIGGVLVVPALLQADGLSLIALGAAAAAWFVLLAADGRLLRGMRGSGATALSIGASATLIALVIAATAPGFIEQGRPATQGPVALGSTVNSLVDLGADLRRPTPVDVLRYTTTAETAPYLQLTTLDTIRGTNWTHTAGSVAPLADGTGLTEVPGLADTTGVSLHSVKSTIDVQNLNSQWVPAPYPATKISGGRTARGYQPDDLTLFASAALSGRSYSTTSLDVEPTAAQLAAAGPYTGEGTELASDDLELPAEVPEIISSTAGEIAGEAAGDSEYDLAVAIQSYFQSSDNGFTYSTDSPDTVDGGSLDVIAKFLEVREGYCVHFASAMAVIARVLGIPSRIAIGYLPGTPISQHDGKTTYQVDSSDLHAWPQLFFPGLGWLSFEPTVSRGSPPAYTLATTPDAVPTTAPSAVTPKAAAPTPTASSRAIANEQAAASNPSAARNRVPLALGILVLVALLAAPAGARAARRRGRLTRLREEGASPDVAWAEIRDTAQDLGFAASATETPRAFAARLRSQWHPDAAHQRDLDEILALVERSEFGPPRPWARYFELADQTARVLAAMRASRHWTTRAIATFAPRSLFAVLGERRREPVRTGM